MPRETSPWRMATPFTYPEKRSARYVMFSASPSQDRKSTRLNSSHPSNSYAAFCLKKKKVYKKQTGGRGKFADIIFRIEPADENVTGLQFINEVTGGNIPKEFIPSMEK